MSACDYTLREDGKAIECHACGKVSHNAHDVAERYCGNCEAFLDDALDAMDPALLALVEDLSMEARAKIAQGLEVSPGLFIVSEKDDGVTYVDLEMGTSQERYEMAAAMRLLAAEKQADYVAFISEAWGLAGDKSEREALHSQFGNISAMPDRQEILLISLESPTHYWISTSPITGTGADRRCGPLEFRRGVKGRGRFTEFLSTPRQKAERAAFLAALRQRLESLHIDPDARVGTPDGELPFMVLVEQTLIKHPSHSLDEKKLTSVVNMMRMMSGSRSGRS